MKNQKQFHKPKRLEQEAKETSQPVRELKTKSSYGTVTGDIAKDMAENHIDVINVIPTGRVKNRNYRPMNNRKLSSKRKSARANGRALKDVSGKLPRKQLDRMTADRKRREKLNATRGLISKSARKEARKHTNLKGGWKVSMSNNKIIITPPSLSIKQQVVTYIQELGGHTHYSGHGSIVDFKGNITKQGPTMYIHFTNSESLNITSIIVELSTKFGRLPFRLSTRMTKQEELREESI